MLSSVHFYTAYASGGSLRKRKTPPKSVLETNKRATCSGVVIRRRATGLLIIVTSMVPGVSRLSGFEKISDFHFAPK